MNIKIFLTPKIGGELIKNIGLGVFVNSLYGISDGSIELFNLIDIFIGVIAILIGIMVENKQKE
jgi:hypothetical protein